MHFDYFVSKKSLPSISPTNFGHQQCTSNLSFGPACRSHWLIHYVTSGHGTFIINNKTYSIRPGEMFIIPPLVPITYTADEQEPWHYIWIGFTCDSIPPINFQDTYYAPSALKIFEEIQNYTKDPLDKEIFLCTCLWKIFSILCKPEKKMIDYIETAMNYIHAEYINDITVAQIAEYLSLDRSYFSTLFKQKVGISPKEYILNHRMTVALSLMTGGQKNVTIIANSVGYRNINDFSRMFKKHFKISPKEYIKRFSGSKINVGVDDFK